MKNIPIKLQDVIFEAVENFSSKVCFEIFEKDIWRRLTYAELSVCILRASKNLTNAGIKLGDRVILLGQNNPDTMIAFFAVLTAGATAVFIDPDFPSHELRRLFDLVDARGLLIAEKYLTTIDSELVRSLAVLNIKNNLSVCDGFRSDVPMDREDSLDVDTDVAAILFTSGTTGHSNGVMLTHENFIQSYDCGKLAINLKESDKVLSFLPIHHIAPLTVNITNIRTGTIINFIEKLDASAILSALQTAHPTVMGVVPLLLELFLKNIEEKIRKQNKVIQGLFRSMQMVSHQFRQWTGINIGFYLFRPIQNVFGGKLTRIMSGAAPARVAVLQSLADFGFTIIESYGLTETTGPFCSNRLGRIVPGSIGIPIPSMEIKIVTPDQAGVGEIAVRGPLVMKGYFRDSGATKTALRDGWLHTGDMGLIDGNGDLRITGRLKELIILSSGKKVIPADVEYYYQNISGVLELIVFGMPEDEQVGERIYAAIVLDEISKQRIKDFPNESEKIKSDIENSIYQHSSGLTAQYQIQRIFFLDELPKTAMLKVKRTLVKKMLMAEEARQHSLCFTGPASDQPDTKDFSGIVFWIQKWISSRNGVLISEIDPKKPFIYYGLDSLSVIQLCEELQSWLNRPVHPAWIRDNPVIDTFASCVSEAAIDVAVVNPPLPPISGALADPSSRTASLVSANEDWLLHLLQFEPHHPAYRLPVVLELNGSLDPAVFKEALQIIIQRNEVLRTSYDIQNHTHKLHSDTKWQPRIYDWSHRSDEECESELKNWVKLSELTPFNYSECPLLKVDLIKKSENQWFLIVVFSHLIADGWTISLFFNDLLKDYLSIVHKMEIPSRNASARSYNDFIVFQNNMLVDERYASIRNFWKEEVNVWHEPQLTYDGDSKRNPHESASFGFSIDRGLSEKINGYAKSRLVTSYVVFLSVLQKTLCDFFGLNSISLKILTANRENPAFQTVFGFLANGLLFNNNVDPLHNADYLVGRTDTLLKLLYPHQEFPFEWLYKLAKLGQHQSCKIVFNWHNYMSLFHQNEQFEVKPLIHLLSRQHMWSDGTELSFNLYPGNDSVDGIIRFRPHLFDRLTIEKVIHLFMHYLRSVCG